LTKWFLRGLALQSIERLEEGGAFCDRPYHNRGDERFIHVWMSTFQHYWKSIKSFMERDVLCQLAEDDYQAV